MLILGIILFGVIAGWVARTLLGRSDLSWGRTILFGLIGSFVGGLLFSLLAGDGLALRPSGLIGSILGRDHRHPRRPADHRPRTGPQLSVLP